MKKNPKLFMLLLGCKPPGRNTEQHDVFFGIAHELKELVSAINEFWPEANGNIHIDAWREVNTASARDVVAVIPRKKNDKNPYRLFFLNLGGYRRGEFDEQHYRLLVVAKNKGEAVDIAKGTAFYGNNGFPGANSHIDDKYGVDVDDIYEIEEVLQATMKERFTIRAIPGVHTQPDEFNLGYLKLSKL